MYVGWEYRASTELPEGTAALIVDAGERVVVLLNAGMPVDEVAPALTAVIHEYRASHRAWEPVSSLAG